MLITIPDLHRIQADRNHQITSHADPNPHLQEQLRLVIRQWQMGLPIQPLLDADPVLNQWVQQVQMSLPNLFKPGKRLSLHTSIPAILDVEGMAHTVQVEVNLGFRHGIPKLFEWGLRAPALNWRDRVNLWTVAQHLAIAPSKLKLIVVALHPNHMTQTIVHHWSDEWHEQTKVWLVRQLAEEIRLPQPSVALESGGNSMWSAIANFDAIEEVVIEDKNSMALRHEDG